MKIIKPFGKAEAGVLQVRLCDREAATADPWAWTFRDVENAEVSVGSVFDADADALVSPANSFGDMGGGVDRHIDLFYERRAQPAVMETIRREFYGELPVGCALVVPMNTTRFPFLVCAPTMRVPGSVAGSLNAYLAFRGVLVAILRHNAQTEPNQQIRSLAVTGLATGVGGMDAGDSAEQMRAAWDNVVGDKWRAVVHPVMAPYAFGRAKSLRREDERKP